MFLLIIFILLLFATILNRQAGLSCFLILVDFLMVKFRSHSDVTFFSEISLTLSEGSNYQVKEEKALEGRKSGDSGRKDKNSEIRGPWVVENYMVSNGSALESKWTFTWSISTEISWSQQLFQVWRDHLGLNSKLLGRAQYRLITEKVPPTPVYWARLQDLSKSKWKTDAPSVHWCWISHQPNKKMLRTGFKL